MSCPCQKTRADTHQQLFYLFIYLFIMKIIFKVLKVLKCYGTSKSLHNDTGTFSILVITNHCNNQLLDQHFYEFFSICQNYHQNKQKKHLHKIMTSLSLSNNPPFFFLVMF